MNNYLCPSKVIYSGDYYTKFILDVPLKNLKEITIAFNDLGIENEFLDNVIFDTRIIQEINKEDQRLDFLELDMFNQRLDSIFQDYNQQLLQNPYNFSQQILIKYSKIDEYNDRDYTIHAPESIIEKQYKNDNDREIIFKFRENLFRNRAISMMSDFESLNFKIKETLQKENPVKYFEIYYFLNPDKKIKADEQYLECWCKYKRIDFDLLFIERSRQNWYDCECRKHLYFHSRGMGVREYFPDRTEFDKFYDQGEEIILLEIEKRKVSKIIKTLLYQRGDYQTLISANKNKSYYADFIKIVILNDSKVNKEWVKNGQLFINKTEFYEAYISDNYKNVLKEKKKQ